VPPSAAAVASSKSAAESTPGILEKMVQRDDLGDHGDVLARVQRYDHPRHLHSQNVDQLGIEPRAIVVRLLVPGFELNDHLDPLLLADRPDPEQGRDVDDADAADLHVMALQLVPAADDDLGSVPRDDHDVVGDEPMSPLDQIEDRLALADRRSSP
jgi:hypothetical protein